ncbi:MAG: dihydroorotase [Muribaculaceae bacterium]|nr:dihydroorotase [Muribaculaceae bacterium]
MTAASPERQLIHNARIVNEGRIFMGYVLIEGELIAEVAEGDAPEELIAATTTVIDARERLLMPGCIDEHVHFRDPGLTEKADMSTESRAAVAGGVTSFIDMPNTIPPTVTCAAVEDKMKRAAEVSMANYAFFIGATNSNIDELLFADYSRVAGVKLFMGSSTGNMLVDNTSIIDRIFAEVPALIAVHAEDEALIAERRTAVTERYGKELEIEFHPVIRNHEVCRRATARAVELARRHNARLHVLHLSTADELQYFSAGPVSGKRITCETCPQYLVFSDEQYAMLGARIKCNPAIKRPADRDALREALREGVIDTLATDHAPHLLAQKRGTAFTAVSGMPLIQFALPVMMELVNEGTFTATKVVEAYCHNPATLFGIDRRGFIRPGYYADLVLVDDDCEPYTITDAWAISRCGWTPFSGLSINNRVDITWVNGRQAYRHGVLFSTVRGKSLRFMHK